MVFSLCNLCLYRIHYHQHRYEDDVFHFQLFLIFLDRPNGVKQSEVEKHL